MAHCSSCGPLYTTAAFAEHNARCAESGERAYPNFPSPCAPVAPQYDAKGFRVLADRPTRTPTYGRGPLPPEVVFAIQQRPAHVSCRQVAMQYGISPNTVSEIDRRAHA